MAVGITAWHPGSAPSSFRAVVEHTCTRSVVGGGESGTQRSPSTLASHLNGLPPNKGSSSWAHG